jgi:hypothetical protein
MQAWRPKYEEAVEYPATRIYMALREGKLTGSGKALRDRDPEKAVEILKVGERLSDLPTVAIPREFWSLKGIDWTSNCARGGQEHYCWIRCRMDEVLSVFPAKSHSVVSGVERIGENFVLSEAPYKAGARARGRPSYPWEAFDLEVTDLLLRGDLPEKKEAGIQHLQDWFEKTHNLQVSRTAIGQRLKPYYDRFIKSADRK